MKNYYDFDNLEIKEESEEQKKRKKILTSIGSLFLAFLMLSFIIPHDVIQSVAASTTVRDNVLNAGEYTIVFEKETSQLLHDYYLSHQLTEFKLCLTGTVSNNTYMVTSMYAPRILFATPISVHATVCNQETIIDLHSHPFKECRASEQDSISYQHYRRKNQDILAMVMCDTNRFGLYGY